MNPVLFGFPFSVAVVPGDCESVIVDGLGNHSKSWPECQGICARETDIRRRRVLAKIGPGNRGKKLSHNQRTFPLRLNDLSFESFLVD